MKPIKVAVDIRDLRIAKTGVRTYTLELINEFNKYPAEQIQFIYPDTFLPVYTGRNKFLKLIEHLRYFTWKQLILPITAFAKGCDIIFCADFFVPYFSFGIKTVPMLHDAFFFEYPEHYNSIWLWLFRKLGVSAARRAAAIITPTNYTKNKIAQLSGIHIQKLVAIYEGPKTLQMPIDSFANTVLPEGQKYILHVGVLEKRKNLLNLLKAFLLLQQTNPELKLVLVGAPSPKTDMDDSDNITAFIDQNNLQGKVLITGYVPDAALASYYKNALMYVFPSINEGFGIPVLEAFSQQVPVLIANNSCLPEVAGDAAITFNPFDAEDIFEKIKMVAGDQQLRETLIARGNQRIKQFTWQHAAKQTVALFETLIEKKA